MSMSRLRKDDYCQPGVPCFNVQNDACARFLLATIIRYHSNRYISLKGILVVWPNARAPGHADRGIDQGQCFECAHIA